MSSLPTTYILPTAYCLLLYRYLELFEVDNLYVALDGINSRRAVLGEQSRHLLRARRRRVAGARLMRGLG